MSGRATTTGWIVLPVLLLAGLLLTGEFVATPRLVVGHSMEPSLLQGDRVFVDRWTYRHRPPRPGEIAWLVGPSGLPMIKRVTTGAANDPGRLWVSGDNPAASTDSRHFGPLELERIHGRVLWRYWPPSRAGRVH